MLLNAINIEMNHSIASQFGVKTHKHTPTHTLNLVIFFCESKGKLSLNVCASHCMHCAIQFQ